MKKIYFFLSLISTILLIYSCSSNVKEEKYSDGKTYEKYEISKREDGSFFKNGYYKLFYPSGNLEKTGSYKDGIEEGLWTEYFDDGKIKATGNYKNGKREGLWTEYYNNGQKEVENNYITGELNGTSTFWSYSGSIEVLSKFENGNNISLVGSWYFYYPDAGLKYADTIKFYKDGTYEILSRKPKTFLEGSETKGSYTYSKATINEKYGTSWKIANYEIEFSSLNENEFEFTVNGVTGNYKGKRIE